MSKWWDKSIMLVEGCTPVSEGCQHCWSAGMAHRFNPEFTENGHFNGKIICHEDRLERIMRRKKPTRWTIWNDLFHPDVDFDFIDKVMAVIAKNKQHIFQILTKRPQKMFEYFRHLELMLQIVGNTNIPIPNLWLGVTAENQEMADKRIPILLQTPAAVRFVSVEPMLSAIGLKMGFLNLGHKTDKFIEKMTGVDRTIPNWIIVGAESGPGKRYIKSAHILDIVGQCAVAGVPVFVKQIHDDNTKKLIKEPAGWPREYPKGGAEWAVKTGMITEKEVRI